MRERTPLETLARIVAGHPRRVLWLLAGASFALSFALPRLTADSSPRALLASADPAQEAREQASRAHFGSSQNVVALVVSSDEALARAPLGYVHELTRALSAVPSVERVDALTTLRWPLARDEGATLEQLADEPSPSDDESPESLGAAADLVAAAPDVFPLGLASLAEHGADKQLVPLVAGAQVNDADVARIEAVLAHTTRLDRRLVSRDRKHLLVAVQLSDALSRHAELAAPVERIEAWLAAHPPPSGTRVSLSGLPVIRTSLVRHMRADQRVLVPGTLLASFLVLALSYRWLPAVLLPLVAVAVTALWLLGGMALAGESLNVLNNMLPALVIIIGLNEAVHIIGRYSEESVRTRDKRVALERTVRAMGAACLATTATSAVGMLALVASHTEMLRRFGIVGALGLLLAYAITLLLVPASLSLLHAPPSSATATRELATRRGRIERLLSRTTTGALRHPWLVLTLALAVTLAAGASTQELAVDSTLLDPFAPDDPIPQSVHLLESEFEGVRPLELTVDAQRSDALLAPSVLRALHDVASWAAKQPGVLGVSDPSEPLAASWALLSGRTADVDQLASTNQTRALATLLSERDPRLLGSLLTPDGRHARVRIKLTDLGSQGTTVLAERARERLAAALARVDGTEGIEVGLAGDAYLGSRGLDAVVADLSGSVLLAALMIFLLLCALLRDLPLALLAVPANILPQVWTMGWMVLREIPLNASSAIIFSLSIGLAVDGSIHLVSRFQEERAEGLLTTSALVRAVRGSGRSILVSSAALCLGFSALRFSQFVPVQRFAELITVSMAGSVIATLLVQPVLLRVFLRRRMLHVARTAQQT